MSVGMVTGLMVGGAAFSAVSQIAGANQQAKAIQKQAEYNAQVMNQQAAVIQEQKKIREIQYNREIARARSTIISKAAGKGLTLSGSPLSVLADTESQMQFDRMIEDYNSDVSANYAQSGAAYYRSQGALNSRLTKYSGYANAFSGLLNTGALLYSKKGI